MSNLIKQIIGTSSRQDNVDIRIDDGRRSLKKGKETIEIKNIDRKNLPEYIDFLGNEIPHSQNTENLFKMKKSGNFKNDIPTYISELVTLDSDISKICVKILNKEVACNDLTKGAAHQFVGKHLMRSFIRANKFPENEKQIRREKLLLECVLLQKLIQQEFKKLTNK